MKTGLYTGRFQPFHLGHLSAVKQALREVDKLYIAIGSTQYDHEPKNPLTAEERQAIIETTLKEKGIPENRWEIFLVPDIHDDNKWTAHVRNIVPKFETVFVGDEGLVKELFEKDGTPVKTVKKEVDVSATRLRESILNNEDWESLVSPMAANELKKMNFPQRLVSISASPTHK